MTNNIKESIGPKPSKEEGIKMKAALGLHHGVAVIIGTMIGSGIFVSPKGVLQEVGSVGVALIIWVLCGVISFFGALCYAELGTSILKSGGDFAYIREAFGKLWGFLYLWVALLIIIPAGNAIMSLTFSYYIIQPAFTTCDPPDMAVRGIAALAILLLTLVNCYSVDWAARLQNIFTVTKLLALAIIIIIGIIQLIKGEYENFYGIFEGNNNNAGAIAVAFYSGLFSYSGWNTLNFVTEEIIDPYKNLPRSIWISIPLVTIVYTFTNVAYFTVLSPARMIASNAVAVTFADEILGVMSWCMPIFVAASTFGALNCCIFTSARLAFVGAREGVLPNFIALININRLTPMPALVIGSIISLLMLITNDIYVLINYTSFVESLFMGFSVAALLYLRWKRPEMPRPIKVSLFFPIFFMSMIGFLVIFPLFHRPMECLMGMFLIITGIPVYLIMVYWKSKPKAILKFSEIFTLFIQKLFLCVEEESVVNKLM